MRKSHQGNTLVAIWFVVLLLLDDAQGKLVVSPLLENEETKRKVEEVVSPNRLSEDRKLYDVPEGPIEVQCSADVKEFFSYVGVRFIGDEEDLNCCEIPLLEEGFELIYNGLAKGRCDEFFRRVERVNLNVSRRRKSYYRGGRRTQEEREQQEKRRAERRRRAQAGNASTVPDGSSFFNTAGECRGCPADNTGSFDLFDDGFRRRRAQALKLAAEGIVTDNEEEEEQQDHSRHRDLYGNAEPAYYDAPELVYYDDGPPVSYGPEPEPEGPTETCTCPPGSVDFSYYGRIDIGPDAPSIEEFRRAFNDYIDMLVREGFMESITGIAQLEEFDRGPRGAVLQA